MNQHVLHGDCLQVLKLMGDNSVDSIVTDPPYGLSFMGKRWDYDVPSVEVWSECLRVLKPGGHLLAFAGTRTQHRMAVRIEDAGFEIRDMIAWVYGSGFPKSLDVSKAIDQRERGAMVREKLMHFAEVRGVDGKWLESHGVASASSFKDWTTGGHVPGEKNWTLVKAALGVTPEEEAAFEREVIRRGENGIAGGTGEHVGEAGAYGFGAEYDITAPATDAARQWQGWGTALKPALEPITVARKPLAGTVAENVLAHGTGALNIDGCRVPHGDQIDGRWGNGTRPGGFGNVGAEKGGSEPCGQFNESGRWPANLIHDGSDEVLAAFPQAPGQMAAVSGTAPSEKTSNVYGRMRSEGEASADSDNEGGVGFKMKPGMRRLDTGSAARFFYCAKASRADRNEGTESLPQRIGGMVSNTSGQHITRRDEGYEAKPQGNHHPTVKPTDLMRYLCRLVTPPGGLVLDPFAGSGSSGKACVLEGFAFIGIEREAEYVAIARARLDNCVLTN